MTKFVSSLSAIALLLGAGCASADNKDKKDSATKQTSGQSAPATGSGPVVLLVPIEVHKTSTSAGCWATIYDGHNYTGKSLTLVGPVDLTNMKMPDGTNWEGQIDSIQVGPKASLHAFGSENYKDKDIVMGANTNTADLKRVPMGDDIESMRLSCSS